MDAKTFTDQSYDMDQHIAAVGVAVQTFRRQWGELAAKLAFEDFETEKATESLTGGVDGITAILTTAKERLEKFIADIQAERDAAAAEQPVAA